MPGMLTALRIPVDPGLPCEMVRVPASAAALSDAIGGGMLDEALVVTLGGARCCLYADERRLDKDLPENPRAAAFALQLAAHATTEPVGSARPGTPTGLRGDVLVTGLDRDGNDADLSGAVLSHAVAAGLVPQATD